MLDNQLIIEIISLLNNGFAALSSQVPTAPIVVQSYQPEQQGANSPPALYLYKIGDNRLGSVGRNAVWNSNTSTEVLTELQQYETQFQISCWVTQNPVNTTALTASDYANFAAAIMQSSGTVTALEAMGVGIYRVGQVRNASVMDDRERFEFVPSFDFTLTHKQIITSTVPIISTTVIQLLEV